MDARKFRTVVFVRRTCTCDSALDFTWRDNREFILCDSGEEMLTEADRYRLCPLRVASGYSAQTSARPPLPRTVVFEIQRSAMRRFIRRTGDRTMS